MDRKTFIKYAVLVIGSALVGYILLNTLSLLFDNKGVYVATATGHVAVVLLNDEKGLGYNELLASYELANSYLNYVNDRYMYKKAVNNLPDGLSKEYTYKELQKAVKAEFIPDTFILKFKAEADNLEDAILLCNFYSEFSLKETKDLLDVGYYSVFEKATEAQYKSRSYIYGGVGAALGAAVCIGILYLNHRYSQTIRSVEKLRERYPELNFLGMIGGLNEDV